MVLARDLGLCSSQNLTFDSLRCHLRLAGLISLKKKTQPIKFWKWIIYNTFLSYTPFYVPISLMISLSLITTSSFFIYGFSLLTHKITTSAHSAVAGDPSHFTQKRKKRHWHFSFSLKPSPFSPLQNHHHLLWSSSFSSSFVRLW